jgi:hypothetical protein
VSPDPPWRLLAGVGRRKYRPPPTGESSPRNRENRGGPFAGDSPAGGLGGGGQPRRREARRPRRALPPPPRARRRHAPAQAPRRPAPRLREPVERAALGAARTSRGPRRGAAQGGRDQVGRLSGFAAALAHPGGPPPAPEVGAGESSAVRVRARLPVSPCLRRLARRALPARCPRLSEGTSVDRRGQDGGSGRPSRPAGPGSGVEPGFASVVYASSAGVFGADDAGEPCPAAHYVRVQTRRGRPRRAPTGTASGSRASGFGRSWSMGPGARPA